MNKTEKIILTVYSVVGALFFACGFFVALAPSRCGAALGC
jgi:hypothetical protein